jgi:hypothetical protein
VALETRERQEEDVRAGGGRRRPLHVSVWPGFLAVPSVCSRMDK